MSAEGWCPKHDKVFESKTGVCPECGTKLVALGAATPSADSHEEIVSQEAPGAESRTSGVLTPEGPAPVARVWFTRGIVAAAIAGAFALGLVFPNTDSEPAASTTSEPVERVLRPAKLVARDEGALRLDRVIQNGKELFAEFAVFQGFGAAGSIEGVSIDVTTLGRGGARSSFSVPDVKVATSPSGFTISGTLEVADEAVVEIRVASVQVVGDEQPSWNLDISNIWPAGNAEPKVLRPTGSTRSVGAGSVRLTALLGWSDRLEAVFELRGVGTTDDDLRYRLAGLEIVPRRGPAVSADEEQQVSPSQVIVRFSRVPESAGTIELRATRVLIFMNGPWTYTL